MLRGQSHIDSSQAEHNMDANGLVNLCDAKKLNSKYRFFEK